MMLFWDFSVAIITLVSLPLWCPWKPPISWVCSVKITVFAWLFPADLLVTSWFRRTKLLLKKDYESCTKKTKSYEYLTGWKLFAEKKRYIPAEIKTTVNALQNKWTGHKWPRLRLCSIAILSPLCRVDVDQVSSDRWFCYSLLIVRNQYGRISALYVSHFAFNLLFYCVTRWDFRHT